MGGDSIAKIRLDKYYTPIELAKYCIDKTYSVIGRDSITEIIEPSAGNGSFSNQIEGCIAYDIEPESEGIIKQDFLKLELPYKRNRLIIGNPPYGTKNNLALSFYKKSIQLADYIAFIFPISQYKNDINMYEFDLMYSGNLGRRKYSNMEVHCCLNIYKRPSEKLNKKPSYKLKDVEIRESRKGGSLKRRSLIPKSEFNYDLRIRAWGGTPNVESESKCLIGCEVDYENQYAKEFAIKIHNEKYKNKVIDLLKNVNWLKTYPMTATPNLSQWQVYKYIKEKIPEIE